MPSSIFERLQILFLIMQFDNNQVNIVETPSPAPLLKGGSRTFQKLSHLYGGERVPKILLERVNNPEERGGGLMQKWMGCHFFVTLQFSYILFVYVCVWGGRGGAGGNWEQSFLYYSLDLHSLELTIQDSHPNLYDIKTFYHLYISDISDPF